MWRAGAWMIDVVGLTRFAQSRRKRARLRFVLAVGIALVLLCGTAATLFALIRHEPTFYQGAAVPPGPTRTQRSQEFYEEFCELISAIGSEREWYATFIP